MPDLRTGSRWKNKYQDLIKEQEVMAEQFDQRLENLKRGLAKISVAAQGQDPALDQALKALRKALQKDSGESALNAQMDALEAGIHAMDKNRSKRTLDAADALSRLLQQLQDLAINRSASRALNKLDRRIKKASAELREPFDIELWLEQVVAAQGSALRTMPDMDVEQSRSWLRALFASRRVSGADEATHQAAVQQPEAAVEESSATEADAQAADQSPIEIGDPSEQAIAVADETGDGDPHSDDNPMMSEISSSVIQGDFAANTAGRYSPSAEVQSEVVAILLALLADIDVPEDTQSIASQLYKDLEQGIRWSELVPTLDNVVTVVTSALGRDQRDFELFLRNLNEQLLEIASFVSFVDHSQLIHAEQTTALNASLERQVGNIEADFVDYIQSPEQDINALKSRVSGNLDTIVKALQAFQRDQGEQHALMTSQLMEMTQRIETMEKASIEASENLQRQREKLLRDTLTGIANREAYNLRLQQEFDRWQRYQRPLVLAIADVDHFKQINDNYGHAAGDKVLKIIAKTLAKQLRKTDFIARFGGEEFVLLLPETTLEAAQQALEKLRAAVEACPFRFKQEPLTITVSLGATQFGGEDAMAAAFDRADRALYAAKNNGRNRFEVMPGEQQASR